MILDDVTDDARLVVELAASHHAKALGHCDLHILDVLPVPDRLEERIREAEVQDVLNCFLPEVVIDAEDRRLRKVLVEHAIELSRRYEVAAKRLLDDDPCVRGAARLRELADHGAEHAWRD